MAESIGLVASGLTIAEATKEIVSASRKIRSLLEDINEAPAILKGLLDQVDAIA